MAPRRFDKALAAALLLSLLFCLHGIQWGRFEPWNMDQMAFRNLFVSGKAPFNPGWFQKPPLHTYLTYVFCVLPWKVVDKFFFPIPRGARPVVQLISAKLLIGFMFLGCVWLVFRITKTFYSDHAARIVTILFAVSAGFYGHIHFLTADVPVMFWMLLAFFFAQHILIRGGLSDYLLAGFFTGLATATKYNGLAVGFAIVVAHALRSNGKPWVRTMLDRKLPAGLSMVVAGFLIGNPYALFDFGTFVSDFRYNYTVAPVYGERTGGHSYGQFILSVLETVGLPTFLLLVASFAYACFRILVPKGNPFERRSLFLLFAIVVPYFLKFGAFPRLPVRFVLPAVPFFLILSGPLWNRIRPAPAIAFPLLALVILYNAVCCAYVGKRFGDDPRMDAQLWIGRNVPKGSTVESTPYCPHWNTIPEVSLEDIPMPMISGRTRIFRDRFAHDSFILSKLKTDEEIDWYSREGLQARRSEYLAVNSLYYSRFLTSGAVDRYPSIQEFFTNLLQEKYPYIRVYDKTSPDIPFWVYPRRIRFLENRMTIFRRVEEDLDI